MNEQKILLPIYMEGQRIRLEFVKEDLRSLLNHYRESPEHCLMQFGCTTDSIDEAIETEQKAISFGVRAYYKALQKNKPCIEHHGQHVRLDFYDQKIFGIHGGMAYFQENQSRAWVEAFCLPIIYLFEQGFELAITNTRADNFRALHFLQKIGFEITRESNFIKSRSNPLSCSQIHMSCNQKSLFKSQIVQRIFQSKPTYGKIHEIIPKKLPHDHAEVQMSIDQINQVSQLAKALNPRYFEPVKPEINHPSIDFVHQNRLHEYFLIDENHQKASKNDLIHHLQTSYKINTNRYFILKNENDKYYGLISIFLSGRPSFSIHLKCNTLNYKINQASFKAAHESLIKTLIENFSPSRIQVESKANQNIQEIPWRDLGYQSEGLDVYKKWLIWGLIKYQGGINE